MGNRWLLGASGILAGIGVWWVLSAVMGVGFIPAPDVVFLRLVTLLPGGLARHAAASLVRIGAALGAALVVGAPLGLAIGRLPVLDRLFTPLTYILYPIPKIALLPLIMLLFGLGNLSKMLLVFLVLFFQILVSVRDAAREVPAQYLVSLRSLGATRWQAVRYVFAPSLAPALISALRLGTGTALAVLFFAENFGTTVGLGWFVMESWMRISYVDMFAGIMCLGLVGLALFLALDALQRILCRWQRPSRPSSAA
jgi:NitT/TauT family transport system permease protein